MKSRLFQLALEIAAWVIGLAAGFFLPFSIGPQMQCAADPDCARMGDRWWHAPLIVGAALGPGIAATILWWCSRRRAV